MTNSSSTSDKLLDGAMQQFSRHGFAKTSMADIAKASGVSRTSLYNHFQTKEEVFKALSNRINQSIYQNVVEALRTPGLWHERLLAVFTARVGWVYELLSASDYGRELINEKNRICGGSVVAANDKFAQIVSDLLEEEVPGCSDGQLPTRILIHSVNGVLEKAATRSEAEQGVSLLVELFCKGMLQEGRGGQ